MVYAQSGICPRKWDTKFFGIFRYKRISLSRPDDQTWWLSTKNKRTCRILDFAVPADHRVKLKESEKRDKYLDLARKLKKKLLNIKATVTLIVIGALGTVTKGLVLVQELEDSEIRGRVEIIQTTASGDLRILTIPQTPVENH